MTIADDRLEELDFPTPAEEMIPDPPNMLGEVDFDSIPYSDRTLGPMTLSPMSAEFFDWLCNCTPGRGEYLGRGAEATLSLFDEPYLPEPITFTRWEPVDEQHTPSKELVLYRG